MEPSIRIEISGERVEIGAGREMLNMLKGKFYAYELLMGNFEYTALNMLMHIQIVGESSSHAVSGSVNLG